MQAQHGMCIASGSGSSVVLLKKKIDHWNRLNSNLEATIIQRGSMSVRREGTQACGSMFPSCRVSYPHWQRAVLCVRQRPADVGGTGPPVCRAQRADHRKKREQVRPDTTDISTCTTHVQSMYMYIHRHV